MYGASVDIPGRGETVLGSGAILPRATDMTGITNDGITELPAVVFRSAPPGVVVRSCYEG